jgi:hypothetical protein
VTSPDGTDAKPGKAPVAYRLAMSEPEQCEGTFLVTAVDDDSAVLTDVETGQVHPLSSNPDLEQYDAVEGVLSPEPPMNVTWSLVEIEARRHLAIEVSDESPTRQVQELAADQAVGELTRRERAGVGEIHVITVPEETTEQTVQDVVDDAEATLQRAARLGVARVEVRSAPGIISVRYVP